MVINFVNVYLCCIHDSYDGDLNNFIKCGTIVLPTARII